MAGTPENQPLRVGLFPKQAEFVGDMLHYAVAAVTGVGAGKTFAGAMKAFILAQTVFPGSLGLVVAPSYPMLSKATVRVMKELWPGAAIRHWYEGAVPPVSIPTLELRNGSQVLFGSTDDPEQLRGPTLSWVWMDEAALSSLEAFRVLQGRLREGGRAGEIYLTTTPRKGLAQKDWVYQEFVRKQRPDYKLYRWGLRDNPYVSREFIRHLEESYTEDEAKREIDGEFTLTGAATQFDPEWLSRLSKLALAPEWENSQEEQRTTKVRKRLWGPRVDWHQYILGIDPKGGGKDLGAARLLDWTTGEVMGAIRSTNPDPAVLRSACVEMGLKYKALCGPEINGVGAEFALRMKEAGCEVYRRPAWPGEDVTSDEFRYRPWGWVTTGSAQNASSVRATKPLMIGGLQEGFRTHRLSTRDEELLQIAGSWDPEEDDHLPDDLSAAGIACAVGKLLYGEMGSTVAMARRALPARRYVSGPRAAAPFVA